MRCACTVPKHRPLSWPPQKVSAFTFPIQKCHPSKTGVISIYVLLTVHAAFCVLAPNPQPPTK